MEFTERILRHEFPPQFLIERENIVTCCNCGWKFDLSYPEQLASAESGQCFPRPKTDVLQLHVVGDVAPIEVTIRT